MDWLAHPLVFVIGSYLLGSIPTAYMVGRLKGIDIRTRGSGNVGGANAARTLGLKWGVLVGVVDTIKGLIPGLVAIKILNSTPMFYAMGLAAILGHCFPVWLKFRGGKGAGTAVGTLLAVMPIETIILVILALLLTKKTKITGLTNLVFSWVFLVVAWLRAPEFAGYVALLVALIYYTHRDNIERLARRAENTYDSIRRA